MKSVLRIIAFLAGFVIIITLISPLFDGGYWYEKKYVAYRDGRIAGMDVEEPGQIDVLNVGDSLANVGIAPMEMYKDYGITSYTMGRDEQKAVETYYAIRHAMRTQDIKVVLWEAHNITKHQRGMDPYITRFSEFFKSIYPFFRYHYIWKNVLEDYRMPPFFKGYFINEEVQPLTYEDFYDFSEEKADTFGKEQVRCFRKICRFCRDNDIKLILYFAPSPYCYNMRMHNGIQKLCDEEGVDFIDGNCEYDKIQLDWDKDTYDKGDHLNLSGSRKATRYMAEHLLEKCDLEDHRGDPAYQSWNDLWEVYEQEVEALKGTNYWNLRDEGKTTPYMERGRRHKNKAD